jgi:hypothetical protein
MYQEKYGNPAKSSLFMDETKFGKNYVSSDKLTIPLHTNYIRRHIKDSNESKLHF